MPKKPVPTKLSKIITKPVEKIVTTPVRNTSIPKAVAPVAAPVAKQIGNDQIAKRAFEIFASGTGGSETDNWFRAERELRGS